MLPARTVHPAAVRRVAVTQPNTDVVSGGSPGSGMYPQTAAAMYPTPRPDIPYYVGGTAITNQAFYPHEMLHAHEYRALYPPYYYKVHGKWYLTPVGVLSCEDWKLQGTEVEVKYKSYISPFANFKPPVLH